MDGMLISQTATSTEVVVRAQALSDARAPKRYFLRMFSQGQPRYPDFYDADAEPWNLLPELVPDFIDDWQVAGLGGSRRSVIAVVLTLSMPAGTDPAANEAAALALARQEFGGRGYVWIAGDDNGPFVRFLVQYRDEDIPLTLGPADLRRYREVYAQELSVRGIPARATSRASRGWASARSERPIRRGHARMIAKCLVAPIRNEQMTIDDELARITADLRGGHDVLPFMAGLHGAQSLSLRPLPEEMRQVLESSDDYQSPAPGAGPVWLQITGPDDGAELIVYRSIGDGRLYVMAPDPA